MRPRLPTIASLLAALSGLYFAGRSTSEFVEHLDRQMHSNLCTFIPGMGEGSTGCHAALMSDWSSVFRASVWGGLPVALPGMAVFAYLAYRSLELILSRRESDPHAARFLAAAWLVPVLTSMFFGYIAYTQVGELCVVCLGIYISSFLGFGVALGGALTAQGEVVQLEDGTVAVADAGPVPWSAYGVGVAEAFGFVLVPVALYFAWAPDFTKYVGTCGELEAPGDPHGVMVSLGGAGASAIELIDPLCPSCAALEERLSEGGLMDKIERKAVLFPLDSTCNWNVGSSLHPGACTISEAVLCADDKAADVIHWAFAHGEEIRTASKADPAAAAAMVSAAFPAVKSCLGTPAVKNRLNKSMRWAVANHLVVSTPQLFIGGKQLCAEDTDLGLDWMLPRLISAASSTPASGATP